MVSLTLRTRTGQNGIDSHITRVKNSFCDLYNLGPTFQTDGRQFDILMREGDVLKMGSLSVKAFHTPGHTPACMPYYISNVLFIGDVLFMPDYGTARCNFPGGWADILYESVQLLYTFPDNTRVFTCHDYRPGGRPLRCESTIGKDTRIPSSTPRRRRQDSWRSAPGVTLRSVCRHLFSLRYKSTSVPGSCQSPSPMASSISKFLSIFFDYSGASRGRL